MRYKAARARGDFDGVAGLGPELDACVLDTLECAVAQARDGALPAEQRLWWFYSRRRKAAAVALKVKARSSSAAAAAELQRPPPSRKRRRESS